MGNAPHKILNDPDEQVDLEKTGLKYKAHLVSKADMTGWERVKSVFQLDMYGDISPELQRCKDMIVVTVICGAIVGGVGRSRIAYSNFMKANTHVAFETPLDARAKLQEAVILGFGSGAFRIGWRVGVFGSVYSVTSTCLTAYRGKASILDPIAGGTMAGFVYKFHEGPRLMLAGAAIGGVLGLIGGSITSLATAITGLSPDEILANDHKKIMDKRQAVVEVLRSQRPNKPEHNLTIEELHAQMLKEENEKETTKDENSSNAPDTSVQATVPATTTPAQSQPSDNDVTNLAQKA